MLLLITVTIATLIISVFFIIIKIGSVRQYSTMHAIWTRRENERLMIQHFTTDKSLQAASRSKRRIKRLFGRNMKLLFERSPKGITLSQMIVAVVTEPRRGSARSSVGATANGGCMAAAAATAAAAAATATAGCVAGISQYRPRGHATRHRSQHGFLKRRLTKPNGRERITITEVFSCGGGSKSRPPRVQDGRRASSAAARSE